jgi:hypothetical protein
MELAPFPCGRLPGFRRAISLHPSGCVLLCARSIATCRRTHPRSRRRRVTTRRRRCSVSAWPRDPRASSAAPGRARASLRPPEQAADADDRQPVRDDGLRPAEEPGRVRAAGRYEVDAVDTEARAARDRAVPRGGAGGLRRRRRVRRRRHRQRGRQRAGRLPHAAAACPAAAPTSTAGCSGSRPTSSTRPSTCSAWPTTGARAGSTSGASTTATSSFSAGVGLDASVVERVDAHPRLKARSASGTTRGSADPDVHRRYVLRPPGSRPARRSASPA